MSEKLLRGLGVAVKANDAEPWVDASFTIVMELGNVIAALLRERSICPAEQLATSLHSKPSNRM